MNPNRWPSTDTTIQHWPLRVFYKGSIIYYNDIAARSLKSSRTAKLGLHGDYGLKLHIRGSVVKCLSENTNSRWH